MSQPPGHMMSAQPQGYPTGAPPGGQPGYGAVAYPQGGYTPQPGYQGGPPPQQMGYPPQQAGYPGGPPPQQAGYPGGPPPQQAGYPTPQGGYPGQGYPGGQPAPEYQAQAPGYPGAAPGPGAPGAPPPVDQPTYKGPMADDDVMDDPNAQGPQATAPPMEKMDNIPGYNDVNFSGMPLPPPSYDEAMTQPQPERAPLQNMPVITEEQAREALLEHVSQHCCYGKGAARDLSFLDLKSTSAFHYTLETFGEGRSTAWAYEPYRGQPIDTPANGPAPGPWDIPANPSGMFQNQAIHVEVPHTASVKPCHDCCGMCRVRCFRCHGRGRIRCNHCHGRGEETYFHEGEHRHRRCTWCHGDGRRRCYTCHGHGQIPCKTCDARGQLKCYIRLTIQWTNHLDDHIVERTALPDTLIRGVSGQTVLEETYPRVWPVSSFPDAAINDASRELVQKHTMAFPSERLLNQRQKVRVIPVTEAIYKWKDMESNYFVYGFQHKVHAPSYPQQCCCGCTIL